MAGSVNKVILIGNLGKDPEIKSLNSGDRVANFSIATSESWKDKNSGERQERTQWHNIVVYNQNIVKVAESYLKKGNKVYVEGQLETRKWTDQSGQDKYTTEVVLRPFRGELTMLESRGGSGGGFGESSGGGYDSGMGGGGGNFGAAPKAQGNAARKIDEMEDEIPF